MSAQISTRPPLVTVLTPVYNGEKYLAECINSVRNQQYTNWEYIIVDNCSTDSTFDIAARHAELDTRIHVVSNSSFVDVIQNHNIAFRLISSESKYCKVVCADDSLFSECLIRMVEIAEVNPSVGIVGSYQLSGGEGGKWRVVWDGLPYPTTVFPGREICRWHLLGGPYVFGTPTSLLYRSDLIKGTDSFFPGSNPHSDTSACYKYLQNWDFAFVHQVLSRERIHQQAQSTKLRELNDYVSAQLRDVLEYGPIYLTKEELERCLDEVLGGYYGFLARSAFRFRDKEFWRYHKRTLNELGYPLLNSRFAKAMYNKLLDATFNPKASIEKIVGRLNSYS